MAGEWARVKGTVVGLWPLFAGLFLAGFASAVLLFVSSSWGIGLVCIALAGICFSLMYGVRRTERFFIGARGEERVSWILRSLPDKYHVFNNFIAGRVHVDHVVVGPAGVFAVETKNWRDPVTLDSGELLVGGHVPDHPPLAQAVSEAKAVKTALAHAGWTGEVEPVVCFASGTFKDGFARAGKVLVANAEAFVAWLIEQPRQFPSGACGRLVQRMETRDL